MAAPSSEAMEVLRRCLLWFERRSAASQRALASAPPAVGEVCHHEFELHEQEQELEELKEMEDEDDDEEEQEDEPLAECIVCFERESEIVFEGCGHLVYCKVCRLQALMSIEGKKFQKITPGNLAKSYSRQLRGILSCPLCRMECRTVELQHFMGKVYK